MILQKDSWKVIDNKMAVKNMDLSVFKHKGSTIPKDILFYFFEKDIQNGLKEEIQLLIGDEIYKSNIRIDNIGRGKITWLSNFKDILFEKFPNWETSIEQNKCLLIFHRIKENKYDKYKIELILKDENQKIKKLKNRKRINYRFLEKEYNKFIEYLYSNSEIEFKSFNHPVVEKHESYKSGIRLKARNIMEVSEWKNEDIGEGKIIKKLKKAINIKNNNLLIHDNRYGKNGRQDKSLYDINYNELFDYEKLLFDFYKNRVSDSYAFNQFVKRAGGIYPFISYLFFLKSDKKYLPIAPSKFDDFFRNMKLDFKTSGKASWENYNLYISYVDDVREFLDSKDEIEDDVSLLDGHSFIWICSCIIGYDNQSPMVEETILPEFRKAELRDDMSNNTNHIKSVNSSKKFDSNYFISLHKRNIAKGKQCENYVYHIEKEVLVKNGLDELAEKVQDVSTQIGLGYDILSYDLLGNKKYIEVKSGDSNSFYISNNELETMKKSDNYWIYIVDIKKDLIRTMRNIDIDSCSVVPANYKVFFNNEK